MSNINYQDLFDSEDFRKWRVHSDETRRKLSLANTGTVWSQERRDKFSEIKKGTKLGPRSQEHCDRISQALTGRKRPQEIGDRISQALTGRKRPQEVCEKIRQAQQRRPKTPIHTPNGVFPSQRALCERLVSDGVSPNIKAAQSTINRWRKNYPRDYYLIK